MSNEQASFSTYLLKKMADVISSSGDPSESLPDNSVQEPWSFRESEEKLGQLLVSTGLVSNDVLDECLTIAHRNATPIGIVLSIEAGISAEDVARALCIQRLIQGGLSLTMGRIIMRYSSAADVSVADAVEAFSLGSDTEGLDSWLIEMLDSCNLLSREEQERTQTDAIEQDTSWARHLVENEVISLDVLSAAMHSIVLMDLGYMTYDDATSLVRTVATKGSALPFILRLHAPKHRFDAKTVNIPAMFYASETFDERQALDLLSESYKSKIDPLELIARLGILSEKQVEMVFDLHFQIALQLVAQSTAISKLRSENSKRVRRANLSADLKRNLDESLKCVELFFTCRPQSSALPL